MKTLKQLTFTILPVTLLTIMLPITALAHDPALHVKKPEKADCSHMDHSKMDMNDPVQIAMMKKCMKQLKDNKKAMKDMDHSKMDHSKMEHGKVK